MKLKFYGCYEMLVSKSSHTHINQDINIYILTVNCSLFCHDTALFAAWELE